MKYSNKINKDELKEKLTLEEVLEYVNSLGGEGIVKSENIIMFNTICHGGDSHKLYYYDNTHLFRCYTQCDESTFDIFELTIKVKTRETRTEWTLQKSISYVAKYFNYIVDLEEDFPNPYEILKDWDIFDNYTKIAPSTDKKIVELKYYSEDILKYFPCPHIGVWEDEGISYEIIKDRGIKYNPLSEAVIIPHYDIDNNLIGIRERTMIKENETYGKYRPAIIKDVMYNHPLSLALYNLNKSKDNIKTMQKAIIFEGKR